MTSNIYRGGDRLYRRDAAERLAAGGRRGIEKRPPSRRRRHSRSWAFWVRHGKESMLSIERAHDILAGLLTLTSLLDDLATGSYAAS